MRGDLHWEVTVYSRDETKQDECRRRYGFANYVLGDVRDVARLADVFVGHDTVVHAAALKYIPEAEINAAECVGVNIDGCRNVIAAAKAAGIRRVVAISTDKACAPVNIYGASKMVMERLFADEARRRRSSPSFVCVRYGNIVGSTGSVIPVFHRQAKELGHVRITNPAMTRFWMSVDDAIDLIVLALDQQLVKPGAVAIPIVRAMTILDVARAATRDDIPIVEIGERPGEKKDEVLLPYEESFRTIEHLSPRRFFEVLPPGYVPPGRITPFTVSSDSPESWVTVEEMRQWIADSQLL